MVDAQPAGVLKASPDRLDKRGIVQSAQLPGIEGGQAPVLALRDEFVRRRSNSNAGREAVLPQPGVSALGVEPYRQVGDQRGVFTRSFQLALQEPLQPLVEADAIIVLCAKVLDRFAARM